MQMQSARGKKVEERNNVMHTRNWTPIVKTKSVSYQCDLIRLMSIANINGSISSFGYVY